jgi:hypothetical protein
LPNAPLFSQLSPLPVCGYQVLMDNLYLREGGLGDGWLVEISLLASLLLCVRSRTILEGQKQKAAAKVAFCLQLFFHDLAC